MDFLYLFGVVLLWLAVWGLAQGCEKLRSGG
jgi:hypothetical protein